MQNKNKFLVIILILVISLATGCGSNDYLKDENNQILVNETTGQSMRKKILCQPTEETNAYQVYLEHEDQLPTKIKDLPTCKEFKINSGEYSGLWNTFIIKPIAWVILKVGYLINSFGLSVILVGLFIRFIMLPLSIKNMRMSKGMQKIQPEMQRIQRKYAGKTDRESQMAMSQETMMLYQKYKVNPVAGCLVPLLQIPIFFGFLDAIYNVPVIYEDTLFKLNLGMTPLKGLQNGEYLYIVLIILIIVSTYVTFKSSMKQTGQNPAMASQMRMMFIFIIVSITMASFSFPTAIAFYWITTNLFGLLQNQLIKVVLDKEDKRDKKVIDVKVKNRKK